MNPLFKSLLFLALIVLSTCRTIDEKSQSKNKPARDYTQTLDLPHDFAELAASVYNNSPKILKYSSRLSDNSLYFQNTQKYSLHFDFLNKFLYNDALTFSIYTNLIYDKGNAISKDIDAGAIQYSPTFTINSTLKDCDMKPHVFQASAGTVVFEVYLVEGQPQTAEMLLEKFDWIERTHKKLSEKITQNGESIPQNIAYLISPAWQFGPCDLREKFIDAGIPVVLFNQKFTDAFLDKGDVAIYHGAKSYGFLNEISKEDLHAGNYSSKDILLIDEIPIDIGPLSGIISTVPQVPLSHIMLRAINQDIPDIYVKDARSNASIKKNIGKLVEFDVNSEKGFSVRGPDEIENLEQLANAYWDNRVPKLPPLQSELSVKALLSWKGQNPNKNLGKSYGAKGSNFAILDQALTSMIDRSEYENGFLIPFRHYKDHVTTNVIDAKLCEGAAKECKGDFNNDCSQAKEVCDLNLGLTINDFIHNIILSGQSKSRMDAEVAYRREHLFFAQNLIREAKLDKSLETEVFSKILAYYPENQRIRFRSSTNAEDLHGLNGAGLYDSTGGCIADEKYTGSGPSLCMTQLEITRKKDLIARLSPLLGENHSLVQKLKEDLNQKRTVKRAVRKVFASLWTEAAYLSREYYRLNHKDVYMGILVHSSFIDEEANGVAIIKDSGGGSYEFQVSVQKGDISVTNPEVPGAIPDVLTFSYDDNTNGISNLTYAIRSSETKGVAVLNSGHIDSLAKQAVLVHKEFISKQILLNSDVLDIEFKIDGKGLIQIKQGRPLTVK